MKRKVYAVIAVLFAVLTVSSCGFSSTKTIEQQTLRMPKASEPDIMATIARPDTNISYPFGNRIDIGLSLDFLNQMAVIDSLQILKDSAMVLKHALITEVHQYIKGVAPRSRMSATNIVDLCLDNNFDITLLLCQGHLETHFGTSGRNVFGIVGQRHSHPDSYVEPYINLMQKRYIINRTTEQLLASNVCIEGNPRAKYAGNPNYGRELTGIRKDIIRKTNIKTLFDDLVDVHLSITEID
jgi:hypothetical protein